MIALFGDIDNGCKWAKMALTLMSKSFRNTHAMPSVYIPVYGFALFWKEPIQVRQYIDDVVMMAFVHISFDMFILIGHNRPASSWLSNGI